MKRLGSRRNSVQRKAPDLMLCQAVAWPNPIVPRSWLPEPSLTETSADVERTPPQG